jgi:hypothetical protein
VYTVIKFWLFKSRESFISWKPFAFKKVSPLKFCSYAFHSPLITTVQLTFISLIRQQQKHDTENIMKETDLQRLIKHVVLKIPSSPSRYEHFPKHVLLENF